DAKFTTAALARDVKSWSRFGPPLEHTWLPTPEESLKFKDIQPLVSNPWTVLGPATPLREPFPSEGPQPPVDLHDPTGERVLADIFALHKDKDKDKEDMPPPTKPAWHGTILPATDADLWLASAFAEYESIVSLERGYAEAQPAKCLCTADYDKIAPSLFAARARYFAGVRSGGETALAKIKWDPAQHDWYEIASG